MARRPLTQFDSGWCPEGWTAGDGAVSVTPATVQFPGEVTLQCDLGPAPTEPGEVPARRVQELELPFTLFEASKVERWVAWWTSQGDSSPTALSTRPV